MSASEKIYLIVERKGPTPVLLTLEGREFQLDSLHQYRYLPSFSSYMDVPKSFNMPRTCLLSLYLLLHTLHSVNSPI
jgi:hypothetical protein